MKHQNPLFDTPEAAAYLRTQPGTMEVWRTKGKGPVFLKVGRSVRYRLEDLENFLAGCVRSNTTEG